MSADLNDIVNALPRGFGEEEGSRGAMADLLGRLAHRPVPTGRLVRLWAFGSLQAKIAAGYLAYWLKSGLAREEERQRIRSEAHLDAALRLLGGMGYLRGAVMKVGQAMASYPDIVPDEWADALGSLQFEAPPMHYSLLREHVRNELGADPEKLFQEFETRAFAAASFGQVHRARLATGEPVAVKIQYPNIARTVDDDLRNMRTLLAPLRVHRDWDSLLAQLEDIRETLRAETDYVREAEHAQIAREAFADDDDFVVPRTFPELSSEKVLTMDYLAGVHAPEFVRASPDQSVRDRYGSLIARASIRLMCAARMTYADPNPGNYVFMDDGRLGLIDFGCCRLLHDEEWTIIELGYRALYGDETAETEVLRIAALLTDDELRDEARMEVLRRSVDWSWEPLKHEGPFEFDDDYMRRGIESVRDVARRRYMRFAPVNIWNNRLFYGFRALMYRLGARVDMKRINDEEIDRAGLAHWRLPRS